MKSVIHFLRNVKVAIRKCGAYPFFVQMHIADTLVCIAIAVLDTYAEAKEKYGG